MRRPSEKTVSLFRRLFWSRGSVAVCALLLAAHLGVTAWGVHNHQPWRDEAQKWLLARDAGSLAEIWERLPYEGTPALWLLALRPLARGGAPYEAMSWLNWGIVGAAAALLLFASPLPWHLKAAVLASHGMLYQFPVFASNYSLSLLLLFAALALYGKRRTNPIGFALALALLANTSVLGALLALPCAVVLGTEVVRERPASRRRWAGLAVIAAGFVLLAIQLVPSRLGTGSSIENEFSNPYISSGKGPLLVALEAFFPSADEELMSIDAWGALGLLFLLLVAAGIRRSPRALFLLVSASSLLFLLFSRVASVGFRHTLFLVLAIVAALWVAGAEGIESGPAGEDGPGRGGRHTPAEAVAVCLATVVIGLTGAMARDKLRFEANAPITRAREAAEFIKGGGYADRPIVAYPAGAGSSLLPYLPGVRLYYPGLGGYGTFIKQGTELWKGEVGLNPARVLRRSLCQFSPGEPFLVLLGVKPASGWAPYCAAVYAPPPSMYVSEERYWMFACNARSPEGFVFPRRFCQER